MITPVRRDGIGYSFVYGIMVNRFPSDDRVYVMGGGQSGLSLCSHTYRELRNGVLHLSAMEHEFIASSHSIEVWTAFDESALHAQEELANV